MGSVWELEKEGGVCSMMSWFIAVISGACILFSGLAAYTAYKDSSNSIFLFVAFGFLFAIIWLNSIAKIFTSKKRSNQKEDEKGPDGFRPVRFVPHWFLMGAIIITFVTILVSIILRYIGGV